MKEWVERLLVTDQSADNIACHFNPTSGQDLLTLLGQGVIRDTEITPEGNIVIHTSRMLTDSFTVSRLLEIEVDQETFNDAEEELVRSGRLPGGPIVVRKNDSASTREAKGYYAAKISLAKSKGFWIAA